MLLLIDKPKGMTSHDVVEVIRNKTGIKKVGHGGTLDPNATGLLIIGVGRGFTKKLGAISTGTQKEYMATIKLGETTDTDDVEGKILKKHVTTPPTDQKIKVVLSRFTGVQMQTPPQYSAIKIKGKKAYDLARRGKKVELKQRRITVSEANLLDYTFPMLKVGFKVSSGTYIRALARDIGEALGTGAYLKDLRRTKIGEYNIQEAQSLDSIKFESQ